MNRSLITGIFLGAAVAASVAAIGGYRLLAPAQPEFAEVLEVNEVTEEVPVSREVCKDVQVTHRKTPKDEHQILGTAAGAVIGGVAGSQIGGGSGKKIATAAGAIAGGVAGKKTQENIQAGDTYTTTERRCETVQETSSRVTGYDVRYRLGDREGQIRMSQRPGDRIPVRDGKLMPEAEAPQS
jgi:uncharacterized protein YcfJ